MSQEGVVDAHLLPDQAVAPVRHGDDPDIPRKMLGDATEGGAVVIENIGIRLASHDVRDGDLVFSRVLLVRRNDRT